MAVSTVSSLSEAFTAGVSLQVEEPAPGGEGVKEKSGSPTLPSIPEDIKEGQTDVSMEDASKSAADKDGAGAAGEDGADGHEEDGDDDDEDDDDAILAVHD